MTDTQLRSRVFGGAMIAAPLLLLASSVAFAAGGGLNQDDVGGAILFYAMAAFALVVVGLTDLVARVQPRAAAALLVVGIVGSAAGAGFGVDSIHSALPGRGPLEDDGGTAGIIATNLPGLLFPLAFVALGIALTRAGRDLRTSGFALILAGVLFPAARISDVEVLAIVGDLVFVAALAPLGWAMVRSRDAVDSPAPLPVAAA